MLWGYASTRAAVQGSAESAITDGCNQNTTYESVRLANFSNLQYFKVYFHCFVTQLWYLDSKLDSGVQVQANGWATRFAGPSCRLLKKIINLFANGLKTEAIPTEIGWKSSKITSCFLASHRIFGDQVVVWWAIATSSPTSPQTMPKPALESVLPAAEANQRLLLQLRRLRALR